MKKLILLTVLLLISLLYAINLKYKYDAKIEYLNLELVKKSSELKDNELELLEVNRNLEFSVVNGYKELFYGEWELTGVAYYADRVPTRIENLITDYNKHSVIGIYQDKLTLDGEIIVDKPVYKVHVESLIEKNDDGQSIINSRYNPKWDFEVDYICYVFTYNQYELSHIIKNTLGNLFYIKDSDTILFNIGNTSTVEAKRVSNSK